MALRRSRVRRVALCGALTVLVIAPLARADASRSSRDTRATAEQRAASDAASRTAARNKYGIPPFDPSNYYADVYQGKGVASTQASKLKTTITLPEARLFTYLKLCVEVIQEGSTDPALCPSFHPPRTSFDSFDNPSFPVWILGTGPIWIESPRGSRLPFGSFPKVTVKTLALGSIPVSASLSISQSIGRDGYVSPLQLSYLTTVSPLPTSGTVYANRYWKGFTFDDPQTNYGVPGFTARGLADITLSDVKIDGRSVDVGPSCRTSRPSTISLESPAGYYPVTASASSLRGRPGGAQPLSPDDAGSIQGTVAIPPFSGCGNGREDLDPLFTSLVSGPDNPIDVKLTSPLFTCSSLVGTPDACPPYPVVPTPQARAAAAAGKRAAAAAAPASSPMWSSLSAAQLAQVVKKISAAPTAVRRGILASLPASIAAAVRAAAK